MDAKEFLNYLERFARLESKVDMVLSNQLDDKVFRKEMFEKVNSIEDRVAKIETEKSVWGRVITAGVGFAGVLAGKFL